MMGIYCIKNKNNGKIYVGQSSNFEKRKRQHFTKLRHNTHENSFLQRSFNKYGEDSFEFEILDYVENPEERNELEEKRILEAGFPDKEKCYNITTGGENWSVGESNPFYGKTHSKNSRKKMSKAKCGENHHLFGKHLSESHKLKIKESNKGKKRSAETCKKISESHKGLPQSLSCRVKRAKRMTSTGILHVTTGKSQSLKQGYRFIYKYRENNKSKSISSTNIYKLKQKVIDKGLEWVIIDYDRAKKLFENKN